MERKPGESINEYFSRLRNEDPPRTHPTNGAQSRTDAFDPVPASYPTHLDTPLLKLTTGRKGKAKDYLTLRQAVEGFQIFGGIGSGKSSGSGKTLARTFLRNGFGGLVLTVKNDEIDAWVGEHGHLRATGREQDAVILDMNAPYTFNPFLYEMTRPDGQGRRTSNLRDLIVQMYLIGLAFEGKNATGSKDPHWDNIRNDCMNRTIDLLKLADEEVSVINMRKVITTIPTSGKVIDEFVENAKEWEADKFFDWLAEPKNYCFYCLNKALTKPDKTPEEKATWELVDEYFLDQYPERRTENERGSIQSSFVSMAEPFIDPEDILRRFFSEGVHPDVRPEACYERGKIIILNFPTDVFGISGNYAQTLYKLVWQKAMSRRNIRKNDRPVFLWIDECQKFVNSHDADFFSKCRSKRICSVLLNQNLPNYYNHMGGKSAEHAVDSLLGNLQTKIFHQNTCSKTNEWAAKTIGKTEQEDFSTSVNLEDMSGSASSKKTLKDQVLPSSFTTLKKGGGSELVSEAVIMTSTKWSSGKVHARVLFDQTFMER